MNKLAEIGRPPAGLCQLEPAGGKLRPSDEVEAFGPQETLIETYLIIVSSKLASFVFNHPAFILFFKKRGEPDGTCTMHIYNLYLTVISVDSHPADVSSDYTLYTESE